MSASTQPHLNYITHELFVSDVESVADQIGGDGWRPDFVVGIGRGGLVPAAYLSHRTGIAMLSVDHSSKVAGFADDLLVQLAAKTRAGLRILFLDDINDSGSTIVYLRGVMADNGAAAENLRVAVLINNRRSNATVEYWSREIDRATDKDWFVFPWEAVATRVTLVEAAQAVPERLG